MIFTFLKSHANILLIQLWQHIVLAISASIIATLISIPVGIWIYYQKKIRPLVLGIINILQTIPSLALLAFLIPFLGIGIKPTIVTLTLYALLPITRNVFIGLDGIDKSHIEAANSLGLTRIQQLLWVELPLSLPIIIAGIRTATVMTIGITTIAAFIGAGGLGDFIIQGLSLNSNPLILLGAIPAAILALIVDYFIGVAEKVCDKTNKHSSITSISVGLISLILITGIIVSIIHSATSNRNNTVVVASKNFTEQYILANMMSDMIEAKTNLKVIKKFNLGNTTIVQNALEKGAVDLYPEYTGTGYMIVLKRKKVLPAKKTYKIVKTEYQKKYQLTWLKPFGYDNSESLAITDKLAQNRNIHTLSQLATISSHLTIAAPPEFLHRSDGYTLLKKEYGLTFKKIVQMQPDLMYTAIKNNDADVIECFTTDGRIFAYHLEVLKDDKHIYPPYYAAPVIRESVLKKHPEIRTALAPLAGLINNKTIQHLNYLVDVKHEAPNKVAKDFLFSKKILTK